MAWLNREKAPLSKGQRLDTPDGLWIKCEECGEITLTREFKANQNVCPKCSFHYYLSARERIHFFVDKDSFVEADLDLSSTDPLDFEDSRPYRDRLQGTYRKLHMYDAFMSGSATLDRLPIEVGAFEFQFMGGSMGTVVGEKIARLFARSLKDRRPAVIFTSSGGARMQEGILSLMQMAKTCAALSRLRHEGIPFVSILTHPTTGGVAASFATLGDVNIGEPKALIGFAGPRVIEQTIREKLPEGFQRSEYLLDHGMLDMICHRDALRPTVSSILSLIYARQSTERP